MPLVVLFACPIILCFLLGILIQSPWGTDIQVGETYVWNKADPFEEDNRIIEILDIKEGDYQTWVKLLQTEPNEEDIVTTIQLNVLSILIKRKE